MSILTNLRWAREQRTGDRIAKGVLMVIASHTDRDGIAMLSYRTIAAEAEVDESTVRRHVPVLTAAGLVEQHVAKGRGKTRYRLLVDRVVRRPVAAQGTAGSAAASAAQADLFSEAPERRTNGDAADPPETRSAAQPSRSAAQHVSDQQQQATEVEAEVTTRGGSTAPRAGAPGRAGAPPRTRETRGEIVPAAELDATAGPPAGAAGILAGWATGRRLLASQRRELRQRVDALLRQGADPALVPAALDEAHDNPRWRDPVRSLEFAYREVERRASTRARSSTNGAPPGGIDARIDEFLNPAGRTAIGGAT